MQRVAFVMHVKEGQEEEYIRRHRAVWPQVLAALESAGVEQMNIFMAGRQLFLYMEVADYAEAARILGESPESLRWEQYMEPIMEDAGGQGYDSENAYMFPMYTDNVLSTFLLQAFPKNIFQIFRVRLYNRQHPPALRPYA